MRLQKFWPNPTRHASSSASAFPTSSRKKSAIRSTSAASSVSTPTASPGPSSARSTDMRILYVSTAYKPAYRMGGPVASVPATAEALVRAGHEVTVVTTNANLDEDLDVPLNQPVNVDGVTVWYFRREEPLRKWLPFIPYLSQTSGFAYAPDMRRRLPELIAPCDVVDLQTPFVYPILAAGRIARRMGKPLFFHQRGNYLPTFLGR